MGKISYRKVPDGWEHPKDAKGHYIPLYDGNLFLDHSAQYQIQRMKWDEGQMEVERNGRTVYEPIPDDAFAAGFEAIYGQAPDMQHYSTPCITSDPWGGSWQVYSEVSEGTPITQVFPSFEALVVHVSEVAHSSLYAARCKIVMTVMEDKWYIPVKDYEIGGSHYIPQS